MAGVKGRSGGARAGAGRPRKKAVEVELESQAHGGALKRNRAQAVPVEATDMLDLLKKVALGQTGATALQVRAAIAAVQYTHVKAGEGGKKDARKDAAKKAGAGRFASAAPPKLVASGGKKV